MPSICFLFVIANFAFYIVDARFDIFWNVPSELCSIKFGVNVTQTLLKYNILVNDKEKFVGNKITLIYENGIGQYPHIDRNKTDINGGLPQLDKLDEHLELAKNDIQKIIPYSDFDGLGVIDWEAWRPIWEYQWGDLAIYKNRTIDIVKNNNPTWSDQLVQSAAKDLWESTAKAWMLKTLELAKEVRPRGKWCYYLFPDCYNYFGKDHPTEYFCSRFIQSNNDRLSWMWNASTALCPSIYFIENQMKYNESQRVWFLYGKLAEAVRVSKADTRIYPYINYMVHVSRTLVPMSQFKLMLSLIASLGLDGAVIWGSSKYFEDKESCEYLENYIKNVIGPTVDSVSFNVERCSQTVCNGKGRCVWPNEPFTSWKYLIDTQIRDFDSETITCRCQTSKRRYCE